MSELDPVAAMQAKREERRAENQKQGDVQKAEDLRAIYDLEGEYGETNIKVLELPFDVNNKLPVLCAVRCPTVVEMKRFKDKTKVKKNDKAPDYIAAVEALANVCLVYPDKETHLKIREARPGVQAQLGVLASNLGTGVAEDEGKG